MEIAWYLLLFAFVVVSGIASYRLGYSRGLLKGIITYEMLRAHESVQIKMGKMMWDGDPDARDAMFKGLVEEMDLDT